MPRRLDIVDVNIQRELLIYERGADIVARVGYELITTQGDVIQRQREAILTGAARTRAVALFVDIRNEIVSKEGI